MASCNHRNVRIMPANALIFLEITLFLLVLTFQSSATFAFSGGFGGGFGKKATPPKKPNVVSQPKTVNEIDADLIESYDLGQEKYVKLYVPPDALNRQLEQSNQQSPLKSKPTENKMSAELNLKQYYGTGDVVWPSSFALARLLSHCPSFVSGRNVLELGCGLGLVSASVCCHGTPKSMTLSDLDAAVLEKAYKSCTELQNQVMEVKRSVMDWNDEMTWPKQTVDTILASDVLYDAGSLQPLVNVLRHYLLPSTEPNDGNKEVLKQAMIVDPINRLNREQFCLVADTAGMDAECIPFPGMADDFVLINVTPK